MAFFASADFDRGGEGGPVDHQSGICQWLVI